MRTAKSIIARMVRRAARGLFSRPGIGELLEPLEQRALFSIVFSNADLTGTWGYGSSGAKGSIGFDGLGVITGGSVSDINGVTSTPAGTFAVNSDGTLSVVMPGGLGAISGVKSGAMTNLKDFAAIADYSNGHSLTLLVNSGGKNFSDADLNGAWQIAFDGDSADSNGVGVVIFDGLGGVSGGTVNTGTTVSTITGGSYTMNTDGTCSILATSIDTDSNPGMFTANGRMNGSKDLLVTNPPDMQAANANGSTLVAVFSHNAGTGYTDANVNGTWEIAGDHTTGWAIFDGAGNVSGGSILANGARMTLSGTYTVDSAGLFVLNATATDPIANTSQAITFNGALNQSDNAIAMNALSPSNGDNLTMLVHTANHVNHAPNLSQVNFGGTATAGKPLSLSAATLLGASDASDVDGDAIQLEVTAVNNGTLLLNGAPIGSFPAVLGANDTLTWTADAGTSGSISAFSVKAFDGTLASASPVAVSVNTALPGPGQFMNGTWTLEGVSGIGTVQFDDSGNIIGGDIHDDGGNESVPTGNYTISPNLDVVINSHNADYGKMNRTHDVIAVTSTLQSSSLAILVNGGNATFSDADISGTWFVAFDGDAIDNNGVGSITFNGNGLILSGSTTDGTGTYPIKPKSSDGKSVSSYSVNSDGTVQILVVNGNNSTMSFMGALNASKDILAFNGPDIAAAAADDDSRPLVLVRSAGAYTTADAQGTWTIVGGGAIGTVTVNAAGQIVSGIITNNDPATSSLSGTVSVLANGRLTFNVTSTNAANKVEHQTFSGALNASKNVWVMNNVSNNSNNTDNLTLLINSGDHAPTLTKVQTLGTAVGNQEFTISFDDLKAAANEADVDGDALSFQIMSVNTGALSLNYTPITVYPAVVKEGDSLTWLPSPTAKGTITAFTIKAFDGTLSSATAVPVAIKTVAEPTVSVAASLANASEMNGNTTGKGQFKLTRTGGDLSRQLVVNYLLFGSADNGVDYNNDTTSELTGIAIFLAGSANAFVTIMPVEDMAAEGTESVQLVLGDGANIYEISNTQNQATVKIADAASTVTVAATGPNASENTNGTTTGLGTFTFTRTGGDLTRSLTVNYTIGSEVGAATNGVDYQTLSGQVTFGPKATTAVVKVIPIPDALREGKETVTVTIATDAAGPTPASYGFSTKPAVVTIADYVVAPDALTGSALSATISSGTGNLAKTGTYQLLFASNATDNRYLLVGGSTAVPSSMGTYTYQRTNPTDAQVVLTDSTLGTLQGVLHFTSATAATFTLSNGTANTEAGKMTLALPTAASFAPASLAGRVASGSISAGTTPFASSGAFQMVLASSSNHFAFVAKAATTNDIGTYTYEKFANNVGLLQINGLATAASWLALRFTSAAAASYVLTNQSGAAQLGRFNLAAVTATSLVPASLSGETLTATVSGGSGPFATHGTYYMNMSASTYTLSGAAPIANSTGSYTYEPVNTTCGIVMFNDANVGTTFSVLNFTSAGKASFQIASYGAGAPGWQQGTMAFSATPDFLFAAVGKTRTFVQNSTTAPTTPSADLANDSGIFDFGANISPTTGTSVTSATFSGPGNSSTILNPGNDFSVDNWYPNQAAVDAAFPNGAYVLSVNTAANGIKKLNLSLTGNLYPNAPFITNYNAFQSLDPTQAITVNWAAMIGGTTADVINFQVLDSANSDNVIYASPMLPTEAGALNGTATSFDIPANTLQLGKQYVGELTFVRATTQNTTAFPGARVITYYQSLTDFSISTSS